MIFICFLFVFFIGFCESCSANERNDHLKKITSLYLVFNKFEVETGFEKMYMDDSPEVFLSNKDRLETYRLLDKDTLLRLSELLNHSIVEIDTAECRSFDTDIVAIIEYDKNVCDTIGISFDSNRQLYTSSGYLINRELHSFFFDFFKKKNTHIARFFAEYNGQENPLNVLYQQRLTFDNPYVSPPDYGFFIDTECMDLARFLYIGEKDSVIQILSRKPELANKRVGRNPSIDIVCSDNIGQEGSGASIATSCIRYGQNEMLRVLLENGLNPDIQDDWAFGNTLLMSACESSYYYDSGILLLSYGANMDFCVENNMYSTPLQICIKNRNYLMANKLLGMGANVSIKNRIGLNAFDLALVCRYYKMAYKIMENGYHSDMVNTKKGTRSVFDFIQDNPASNVEDRYFANKILLMLTK